MAATAVRRRRGLKFEPGLKSTTTPSTANGLELMDGGDDPHRGCRGSKRLPCIDLERETSGWFWICVGMVIVILTVLSGRPFANPIGQMTEVDRRRPTRMLRDDVPISSTSWEGRCRRSFQSSRVQRLLTKQQGTFSG